MIFPQSWTGVRIRNGLCEPSFPARVPGNIQYDYAVSHGFSDVYYADGCRQFEELERDTWEYRSLLHFSQSEGERVYFVSHGIDYRYDILLNNDLLYSYEGVFAPAELDLTDHLAETNELCVRIYPHPIREGAKDGRSEADHSAKPPVCYGWDWNPRLLISGMWQDAYIETRDSSYIGECELLYSMNEDRTEALVTVTYDCALPCRITLSDREGNTVYSGTEKSFAVKNPNLWWCNGQGEPSLYTWKIENDACFREGKIGFRTVRLVRNEGAEDPRSFPKSRYAPPFTLELNGRRIFMKGTNFVNPDIFWGNVTDARYEALVRLAANANMNIFRMWGGAGPAKKHFYELCDEYGMLVWQEFMLGCNDYPDEEHYLTVLEREATAIIRSLRSHACLAFWCGGNELFNGWSGMTDQSHPLRLLNSLCYQLDRTHPFLATSPLTEIGHGGYMFYDGGEEMGGDVFEVFSRSDCIGYTEFGIPSIASHEIIDRIIPKQEQFPVTPTDAWVLHHGLLAWKPQSHVCPEVLSHYWGEHSSLDEMIEHTNWLQSVGYKASFEEMRRQWPHCSAALHWCYNEPWYTAANCSILSYPETPKPAYSAVTEALRPSLFSARIPHFDWDAGDRFTAEIWLLNDSPTPVTGDVRVTLCVGDVRLPLLDWKNASAPANRNLEGAQVCCTLPDASANEMTLLLESSLGTSSYRLLYRPAKRVENEPRLLNQ